MTCVHTVAPTIWPLSPCTAHRRDWTGLATQVSPTVLKLLNTWATHALWVERRTSIDHLGLYRHITFKTCEFVSVLKPAIIASARRSETPV